MYHPAQTSAARRRMAKAPRAAAAAMIALAAAVSAAFTTPAEAQEGTLVSISVPTELPCVLLADGSVIAPSGYEIENESAVAVRLVEATTSGAPEGISYELRGEAGLVNSYDGSDHAGALEIAPKSSAVLEWRIEALDAHRHAETIEASTQDSARLFSVAFVFESVLPPLTGSAHIDGTARVGEELAASTAGLPEDAEIRIEWMVDGSVVAEGERWTPRAEHVGKTVSARVRDASGSYGGFVESPGQTVAEGVMIGTAHIALSGSSLTAQVEGAPSGYAVTWYRADAPVATGETLALAEADSGAAVEAHITVAGYAGSLVAAYTPIWTPSGYVEEQVWVEGHTETNEYWCSYYEKELMCEWCAAAIWDKRCPTHHSDEPDPVCPVDDSTEFKVLGIRKVKHLVSEDVWVEGHYETESVWVEGHWS